MTDLHEIFNFTDADLKENRKGRLSEAQQGHLMKEISKNINISRIFYFAGFGTLIIILILLIFSTMKLNIISFVVIGLAILLVGSGGNF